MMEGTLREPQLSKFNLAFSGATILRLEERGDNVFAVCVRMPDGGLTDLVLR